MSLLKSLLITSFILGFTSPVIIAGCAGVTHHNADLAGPMCVQRSITTFIQSEYLGNIDVVLPLLIAFGLTLFFLGRHSLATTGLKRKFTRLSLLDSNFVLDRIYNPIVSLMRSGGLHRKITS